MARRALCVGLGTFADDRGISSDLPDSGLRAHALAAAFERLGYRAAAHDELSAEDLGRTVRDALDSAGPGDVVVIHVLSRARTASGALQVVGSDGRSHEDTTVDAWRRGTATGPTVLLLLDLCGAGDVTQLDWRIDDERRAWVIAAGLPETTAHAGRFTEAVTAVLTDLASGRLDIDASYPHAPITTIARLVRRDVLRRTAAAGGPPPLVTANLVDISAEVPDLPFFPNHQRHTESSEPTRRRFGGEVDSGIVPFVDDVDEGLDPRHFLTRAAGQHTNTSGRVVGCFSGRRRELNILTPFIDERDDVRLRVVTGSPGVGKSALIGLLVCAAHPALRRHTQPLWEAAERTPGQNKTMAAVHARERTSAQVVASVAAQLKIAASTADQLVAAVPPHAIVVVDALDEAVDGRALMHELLLPLHRAGVRLLVGMRPWTDFAALRDAADAVGGLLDLDDVHLDVVQRDVETYVSNLLRAAPSWNQARHVGAAQTLAHAVATTLTRDVANREWGVFLVAGMYAGHLLHTYPEPIADIEAAIRLGQAVPRTLPDLLSLDLRTRALGPWCEALLAALANAKGEGMPAGIAAEIAARHLDQPAPDATAVLNALDAVRFYLRRGIEADGTVVYRLFHQGLVTHLRDSVTPAAVVEGVLASQPAPGQWELAEPYVLRHAATHAADAGRVGDLLADAGFLVAADPAAVLPVLNGVPATPVTNAYRAAVAARPAADMAGWRLAFALAALDAGLPGLALEIIPEPRPELPWSPRLQVPAPGATAIAVLEDFYDITLVLGTETGSTLMFKLRRAVVVPIGSWSGTGGPIVSVAAGRFGDTTMVAAVSASGLLSFGRPHAEPVSTETGTATQRLQLTEIGGRLVAVLIGPQGSTNLWDLGAGRRLARLDEPHDPSECLVAADRPLRLSVGDAMATVTGSGGETELVLRHSGITSATAGSAGGLVYFTGGDDGSVHAWDAAGERLATMRLSAPVRRLHATDLGKLFVDLGTGVTAFRFGRSADSSGPRVRLRSLEPVGTFAGQRPEPPKPGSMAHRDLVFAGHGAAVGHVQFKIDANSLLITGRVNLTSRVTLTGESLTVGLSGGRLYLVRDGTFRQLGAIRLADVVTVRPGDRLMLCTTELSEALGEAGLEQYAKDMVAPTAVHAMGETALRKGLYSGQQPGAAVILADVAER